jgi:hypothetical protein
MGVPENTRERILTVGKIRRSALQNIEGRIPHADLSLARQIARLQDASAGWHF